MDKKAIEKEMYPKFDGLANDMEGLLLKTDVDTRLIELAINQIIVAKQLLVDALR